MSIILIAEPGKVSLDSAPLWKGDTVDDANDDHERSPGARSNL
jgi:hypothetical protein